MKTPNLNAVRFTIFLGKVKKEKVPLWLFVSGSSKLSIIFVFTYLQLFVRLLPGKVCVFGFGFFLHVCMFPSHGCFDNGCVLSSSESWESEDSLSPSFILDKNLGK